jgi:hypothetical protein
VKTDTQYTKKHCIARIFILDFKLSPCSEGSETSANINQTPGKHPKVDTVNKNIYLQHSRSYYLEFHLTLYTIRKGSLLWDRAVGGGVELHLPSR